MSSLVIVRVRIVSSASAGKASMVLVAMTLANAMILVDQTAVPIALPDIMNGFHVGSQKVQWVLSCSLLPPVAFLAVRSSPPSARRGARLVRKLLSVHPMAHSDEVSPLEIRPARPEEFPAIAELCVAAYEPFVPPGHHYIGVLRDVAPRASDAELLVAADDGAVAGTVTFVPAGGPLGEIAGPDETEFRMLAVDPAARGRGVGTALLQKILDASRSRDGVVCSSLPEMRAAHRIYERLGFRRVPGRDWSPVPGIDLLTFVFNAR